MTRGVMGRFGRLFAMTMAVAAGLAACGGGGGDGGGSPSMATLDLTAANRDVVAHAVAAGALSVGVTNMVPLASGASSAVHASLQRVTDRLRSAAAAAPAAGRRAPLGVIGPIVEPCFIAGSTTLTIDDRDDNGMMSSGDVLTFVYAACQDLATETLDGTVTVSVLSVGATTLPSFRAQAVFTRVVDEATNHLHGMALDGAVIMDYAQLGSVAERLAITVSGSLVSQVHTHAFGNDTVTLQDGFVEDSTYDASVLPPGGGGGVAGCTTSTISGALHSAAAGGIVAVSMNAGDAIVKYNAEAFPRAAHVRIAGARGKLHLVALSAEQVRIDLDDDDDGEIESTRTDAWDWLL